MSSVKVLILGLGQVAIGYDIDKPNEGIKSHLFAIREYGRREKVDFEIFAVDPNAEKRERAFKIFPDINYFSHVSELNASSFDLVVNAVPIPNLLEATTDVLNNLEIGFLFIEKPGAATHNQALELNNLITARPNVYIIYPRRVLESTNFLKKLLRSDGFEDWKISIKYSGSPENILTHFLDLIDSIFSTEEIVRITDLEKLSILQTSDTNNNDHKVIFEGPRRIVYGMGGKEIIDSKGMRFDFSEELQSQIWHTAKSYLDLSRGFVDSKFPTEISQLVRRALGVRND